MKTRRNRTAPLFRVVAEDVREYKLAEGLRSGLLFPTPAGEPWRDHDFRTWRAASSSTPARSRPPDCSRARSPTTCAPRR